MKTLVSASITLSIYGSYSFAHCQKNSTGKLRIKGIQADKRGTRLLKKAVAAFNRGDKSVTDNNGDCFTFVVNHYKARDLSLVM